VPIGTESRGRFAPNDTLLTEQVFWKLSPLHRKETFVSTALSVAVEETPATPLRLVTAPAVDAASREANRWMLVFGGPCLVASIFVAAAIGSGLKWLLGFALASLLVAICSLSWLAISSDTNA
jgi:hypothetical protein